MQQLSSGAKMDEGQVLIDLDSGGDLETPPYSITFNEGGFTSAPDVYLIPPFGATRVTGADPDQAPVYRADYGSITATGFNVEMAISETVATLLSKSFYVQWVAVERF